MEWLILLLAIVVGIPAIFWVGQERLIFFPQAIVSTDHLGAGIAPIEIVSADGTRLHGWIRAANAAPAPVVLYFGGNAEEVSWTIAERRWPTGWTIVAVNYRGYGRSEGSPGEAPLVADALAVYDAIAARSDVDAKHIVAFGRSLGTGVAVKLAFRYSPIKTGPEKLSSEIAPENVNVIESPGLLSVLCSLIWSPSIVPNSAGTRA